MTGPAARDGHDRPKCGAKKRQTEGLCERPAGWGTQHPGSGKCKLHGGSTKTQTVAVERQQVEVRARQLLGELRASVPVTDPAGELQRLAGEVLDMKNAAARLVSELASTRYTAANGTEQLRAEVVVYERALDRATRMLSDMVKLGLEERQVRLGEAQGALIAQAVRAILGDLRLTPDQQALVPVVVPRHLRAMVSGGA